MNNPEEKIFLKKVYSLKQGYDAMVKGMRTLKFLVKNRRKKLISRKFIERLMLSVTEVNGCEMCAYGHTRMALESGMSREEIDQLLQGMGESVPVDESLGVIFGQHYADTGGCPTEGSWERLMDVYGEEKAYVILAAIRMIMVGNIYGIPLSAIIRRVKGKKVHKTTIFYEVTMLLSTVVLFPCALVQALGGSIFHREYM